MVAHERELLQRLRDGDEAARVEIVDVYMSDVYDYLCVLTQDRDVASDLTQETLIRVWTHLDRFRGDCRLATWAKRIALNEYRQHLRRTRRREAEVECDVIEVADHVDIASQVVDADTRRFVRSAVESLPPIYRQVVVMHCYGDASLKEVAGALSIPLGTVKWRLSRAVQILRARIQADAEGRQRLEEHPYGEEPLAHRAAPPVDETRRRMVVRPGS